MVKSNLKQQAAVQDQELAKDFKRTVFTGEGHEGF